MTDDRLLHTCAGLERWLAGDRPTAEARLREALGEHTLNLLRSALAPGTQAVTVPPRAATENGVGSASTTA
jgi:hypothetical protein